MTRANSMKHGWHRTFNNVVCCYQIPFNIALILEQVSNYNNVIRDQSSVKKSVHRTQNNVISDNDIFRTSMRATEKQYVPNDLDGDNLNNERKLMKEDKCVKLKKYMPINYFYKTCIN